MGETLLNWAVMLGSLAALAFIAWMGYQDLQSVGAPRNRSVGNGPPSHEPSLRGSIDGEPDDALPVDAEHLLRVEYRRNGHAEHVQFVTEERPGYIGTESVPGMGSGILVRHARLFHTGDGFSLENRHTARPLAWRADNGRSGELPPGQALPVEGEMDVILGDWTITCREE